MDLDAYGIQAHFTGNIQDIPANAVQTVHISNNIITTSSGRRAYAVKARLGRGTYGTVYSATDDDGTAYAIKRIPIKHKSDLYNVLAEVVINILLLEGTKMERGGPYVPKLYEIGIMMDMSSVVIFQEHMDGTLFDYARKNTRAQNNRAIPKMLLQILHMLDVLESKFQFNHRDLKSDNIMYKTLRDGTVTWRLIDLGAACMKWNGAAISSDAVFGEGRPCMRPGRDISFLITELVLDVPLSPALKALLQRLVTFRIQGTQCALDSTKCPHIGFQKWTNIYNVLNKQNTFNPHAQTMESTLTQFLQKLRGRSFWNWGRTKKHKPHAGVIRHGRTRHSRA
jgi:serine/threonine protein kinase